MHLRAAMELAASVPIGAIDTVLGCSNNAALKAWLSEAPAGSPAKSGERLASATASARLKQERAS